jgi:3-methylcrotonyl-CoA carboxylase alpha subunit
VTEAITGIDLVEWQLRAAAGEALPLRQDQIHMHGHAVEARLCAEDPADDFRPSAGRIERLWGSWGTIPRPREDAGFDVGDAVPPFYDSLLSKVIVSDSSRTRAFGLAMAAVGCVESIGIKTNAGMLAQTLGRFSGDESIGELHTGALQESDLLWPPRRLDDALIAAVAAAAVQVGRESRADGAAWAVDGWRLNGPPRNFVSFNFNAVGEIAVAPSAHMIAVDVKGECFAFERRNMSRQSDGVSLSWWQGPRGTTAFVMIGADMVHVFDSGWAFKVPFVRSEGDLDEAEAGDAIAAPLPGKVVAAPARVGQAVKRGEALITIEAMKMEHALKAPRDGVIAEIAAGEGAQVKEGQVLVRLAPVEEAA